jgi:hypothetical protein
MITPLKHGIKRKDGAMGSQAANNKFGSGTTETPQGYGKKNPAEKYTGNGGQKPYSGVCANEGRY